MRLFLATVFYLDDLEQVGLEELVVQDPQVVLDQQVLLQRLTVHRNGRVKLFQRPNE